MTRILASLLVLLFVVFGFTTAPASAQSGASGISAPVSALRPGVVDPPPARVADSGPITVSGYVLDEWGNPLSGLGWPEVRMTLYQKYRVGGGGKSSWQVVAETACDRYGWGNGCPDSSSGHYEFSHDRWGGDLGAGNYQLEVSAKGFGATRSRVFYARSGTQQDFSLVRLQAYIWIADPSRIEISDDVVTIPVTTFGSDEEDISVLFDVTAVAQSNTNDEPKALEPSARTSNRPRTLIRSLQTTWWVRRTLPGLSELAPGTRVCFNVALRYDGYVDWIAGELTEPTCVTKPLTGGNVPPVVYGR